MYTIKTLIGNFYESFGVKSWGPSIAYQILQDIFKGLVDSSHDQRTGLFLALSSNVKILPVFWTLDY